MSAKTYEIDYGGKTYSFTDETKASQFLDFLEEQKSTDLTGTINATNDKITADANAAKILDQIAAQNKSITQQAQLAQQADSKNLSRIPATVAGPLGLVANEMIRGPATTTGDSDSSAVGALLNKFANSALMNKLPELTSFVSEKLGGLPYNEGVERSREQLQQQETDYPDSALLGNVAGAFTSPIAQIAGKLPQLSSLAGRMGLGAATNVAAGQAELPFEASGEQRLTQGALDTLVSGGTDTLLGMLQKYGQSKNLAQSLNDPKFIPRTKDAVIPEAGIALRDLENAGYKLPVLPAEIQTPSSLNSMQSFLEKSPFSSATLKAQGLKQRSALSEIAQSIESGVGLTKRVKETSIGPVEVLSRPIDLTDANKSIGEMVSQKKQVVDALVSEDASRLQNKVLLPLVREKFTPSSTLEALKIARDESAGGAGEEIRSKLFRKIIRRNNRNIQSMSATQDLKRRGTIFNEVTGKRTPAQGLGTNIWNLYKFNKDINETLRNSDLTATEAKLLSNIKTGILSDLEGIASSNSKLSMAAKDILEHNANATQLYTEVDSKILNALNESMEEGDYQKINTLITKAFDQNDVEGLREIERAVGPEVIAPVKQEFVQSLLRGPGKSEFEFDIFGGSKSNTKSNPLAKRLAGYSDSTLEYVLGNANEVKKLKSLATIAPYLEQASKARKGDTFDIVDIATIGSVSAPALRGLAQGDAGAVTKGIGILGGVVGANKALAKFYTHPEISKLLIYKTGQTLKPSQASFVSKRLISKLVELSGREQGVFTPEENRLSE